MIYADVAELADAMALGAITRKGVQVRFLSSAPVGKLLNLAVYLHLTVFHSLTH